MEVELEKSNFMTNSKYTNEEGTVRISKKLRNKYSLKLYSFVNFDTEENKSVCLQVLPAYTEDVEKNSDALFVTDTVYDLLKKEVVTNALVVTDNLTLGCDPELLLIKNGNEIVKASWYFGKTGVVGNDGHILEFRPPPSTNEETLRDTLYSLIKRARVMINNTIPEGDKIRMVGSSYKKGVDKSDLPFYTTGFHLHFGIPPILINPKLPHIKLLIDQVVKILDYYVGIPSIILEKNEEALRRSSINIQYGKPGNYRLNFPTLEYRVPGGYNLRHPILACGLIGLGAVVVEDVITRIKHCTDNFKNPLEIQNADDIRELYPNLPPTEDIFRLILTPKTEYARTYIDNIYKDVSKMITFDKRKKSICDYFDLLTNKKIELTGDIENNWENYYESRQNQVEFYQSSS